MRVTDLFETVQSKEELDRLLKKHFRIGGKIEYHNDGSISVNGDVTLIDKSITHLPVRFRKVSGNFYCYYTNLTSLEGSPQKVGSFYCHNTNITSLDGAPEYVGGFNCYNTPFFKQFLIDENTQISAVRYLPWQFINILNDRNIRITQSVQIVAVDIDPEVIADINNPTRMAQLTAVKKNPAVIEYIHNPDPLVLQYLAKK